MAAMAPRLPAGSRAWPPAVSPCRRGDGDPDVGLGHLEPSSARAAMDWIGRLAAARAASPETETPPPGVSTSTWKASSSRAMWRLLGPETARRAASERGTNSRVARLKRASSIGATGR